MQPPRQWDEDARLALLVAKLIGFALTILGFALVLT